MPTIVNRTLVLLALLAAGTFAAPAAAQDCEGPPGTAAIEQYCESVPDATGNRATRKDKPHNDTQGETRSNQPRVDEPTLQQIEDSGTQGEQLGRVLRGGEPPAREKQDDDEARADKRDKDEAPTAAAKIPRDKDCGDAPCADQRTPVDSPVSVQAGNPLTAVGAAVSGGDTVGGLFPLILLATAVLVGGAGWLRRGRGGR